jgi:hypothetical protein
MSEESNGFIYQSGSEELRFWFVYTVVSVRVVRVFAVTARSSSLACVRLYICRSLLLLQLCRQYSNAADNSRKSPNSAALEFCSCISCTDVCRQVRFACSLRTFHHGLGTLFAAVTTECSQMFADVHDAYRCPRGRPCYA